MFSPATALALTSLVLTLAIAAAASASSNEARSSGGPSASTAQVVPPADPASALRTALARANATLAKLNAAYGGGE